MLLLCGGEVGMNINMVSIISMWIGCAGITIGCQNWIVGIILGISALTTTKIILRKN